MPFLDSLGPPLTALTVYPSVTKVASAAMLTGAMPKENGVRDTSQRKTDVETILDVLSAEGRSCIAVEGDGLAFNMPNAEVILSGDRDGNGGSDDNTFHNASQVIRERMPDFLWVHFHGIDDVGHSHGPGSDQELTKMREVDGYIRDIVAALLSDTLVIIASDHGMHRVHDQARKGNHGSLTARDMFVPLWLLEIRPETLQLESSAASRIPLGQGSHKQPYNTIVNWAIVQADITQIILSGLAPRALTHRLPPRLERA